MEFDLNSMAGADRDKLMHSVITPRPIALIVTSGEHGVNAAPFSFFNVVSGDPSTVVVGIGESPRLGGGVKDTFKNILETGQFVLNMVTERMAHAMNITALDFAEEVDELAMAGFPISPSTVVVPPRIATSPVSLECELIQTVSLSASQSIVIARVLMVHVDDDLVWDKDRCYIDGAALQLIARMHGGGWYARTTDLFQMPRLKIGDNLRN